MIMWWWIALVSVGMLGIVNPTLAALSLQNQRLTIHVSAVPLETVLFDLSRQDAFQVTVMEKTGNKRSVGDQTLRTIGD